MLDDQKLRERYAETADELARLDDQRGIVADLLGYYERLMQARGLAGPRTTPKPPKPPTKSAPVRRSGRGIQPGSIRGQVLAELRRAKGPIHTKVIAERLRAAGVSLGSKDKTSVVDLALLSLAQRTTIPVRKVAPRTWVLDHEGGDADRA
jgi:hypothetical protein